MPVTSIEKDLDALTMTIVADFPVPVSRLWTAYADPRQIEKFWGPPEYPATFTRHDVVAGGRSDYFMTGPDGSSHGGYWEFLDVVEGESFTVRDGFSNDDGTPNTDMPSMEMAFAFEEASQGSRLVTVTSFGSLEQLEQLIAMGMEEGTREAMGQIDDVLADLASFAAARSTEAQVLSETKVRVSRIIRGSVEQVWRAHHDAELMKRWLLGPDGWVMVTCDLADSVGDTFTQEWERAGGGDRFGFTGELLESTPPHREVTTESMIGMEGDPSINELTLTAVDGRTLLALVITYPSSEVRDIVLGTGMVDGMEASYARLERELVAV
ncbi:SRPBCC family protein [Microbacterium sp. JB110]|uniref:SRPBCC family protein n=1 Tax=Microbacterium sp. JB110 TaxID=2024477 RepID=UPI00097EB4CB|nr:SRPBCC family protein [Microbacterium sp. JB110]RCS58882.1 ATPase [Microbacterium sp. JB110]SJM55371.1 Probable glutathione S-transferase-related transmembrane protein [Frigoribacterium sp. JB110]